MRRPVILLILSVLLTACGGGGGGDTKRDAVAVNNSQRVTTETETTRAEKSMPTATATPATSQGEAPVEFTYLGISPDKERASYKIKVTTSEPLSQVDLDVKYLDGAGQVLEQTTFAWQNIVKSVRQPIEKGKTYEVKDELPQGTAKAEYTLKRVIFQNGSRWNAE